MRGSNKSEPGAVATGSPLIQFALWDPVATAPDSDLVLSRALFGNAAGDLTDSIAAGEMSFMQGEWQTRDTTTHQDHVIAHVIGARVLGHFIFDEALHVLLDIGFIWMILLDGEMGLLPHPVAVSELEISEQVREQIKADIDLLLTGRVAQVRLRQLIQTPVECQIKDVSFFEQGDQRRLIITGEETSLVIETSLASAEIQFYEL